MVRCVCIPYTTLWYQCSACCTTRLKSFAASCIPEFLLEFAVHWSVLLLKPTTLSFHVPSRSDASWKLNAASCRRHGMDRRNFLTIFHAEKIWENQIYSNMISESENLLQSTNPTALLWKLTQDALNLWNIGKNYPCCAEIHPYLIPEHSLWSWQNEIYIIINSPFELQHRAWRDFCSKICSRDPSAAAFHAAEVAIAGIPLMVFFGISRCMMYVSVYPQHIFSRWNSAFGVLLGWLLNIGVCIQVFPLHFFFSFCAT